MNTNNAINKNIQNKKTTHWAGKKFIHKTFNSENKQKK